MSAWHIDRCVLEVFPPDANRARDETWPIGDAVYLTHPGTCHDGLMDGQRAECLAARVARWCRKARAACAAPQNARDATGSWCAAIQLSDDDLAAVRVWDTDCRCARVRAMDADGRVCAECTVAEIMAHTPDGVQPHARAPGK